jgi:hypothetical protein
MHTNAYASWMPVNANACIWMHGCQWKHGCQWMHEKTYECMREHYTIWMHIKSWLHVNACIMISYGGSKKQRCTTTKFNSWNLELMAAIIRGFYNDHIKSTLFNDNQDWNIKIFVVYNKLFSQYTYVRVK